ncbi:MAG: hypothetical protein U1F43_06750 [Myxococcota bacterium]
MPTNDETPTKTLAELATVLPPPDPILRKSLMTEADVARYQELGRQIASGHVIVDGERLFGLAYAAWNDATEEQRALLVGFSPELLSIGVDAALSLRAGTTAADDGAHRDGTARATSTVATRTAGQKALVLRDHGVAVLRAIAGNDETLKARIAAAVGTADTPELIATGTERVAALGKELVASTDPTIAALVKANRASNAFFDRLTASATALRQAIEVARPRLTVAKLAQGDLDVLDGLVLRLLSDFIHAFAAAQDIDGTLPTLAPNATRRLLASRSKSKPKSDATPK